MQVGIDFGTTHTVVALCDRGNYPVLSFLDGDGESHDWFPSVIAIRGKEVRYGFAALEAAANADFTLLRSVKRLLGEKAAGLGQCIELGGESWPLEHLLTGFLHALGEAIRESANLPRALRNDLELEAAVAVPANAPLTQRLITLDAFGRAGFGVRAVLNEPSAAGFEYTHRYRNTLSATRDHIIVYDLGGGTFDASLLTMHERHHEVLMTAGVNQLGGDDFDEVLAEMALSAAELRREDLPRRALAMLNETCRTAKEALLPQSRKLTIDLEECLANCSDARLKAHPKLVTVSAADFYAACEPLITQSFQVMGPLFLRLAELCPLGTDAADAAPLAGIYVVGGASALPGVGRALRSRFGRRVHRSPYPFAATAIGLAIACDPKAGFSLTESFSLCFGVFREAETGREAALDPIFEVCTTMPVFEAGVKKVCRSYRAAHNIGHFRFVIWSAQRSDEIGCPQSQKPRDDLQLAGELRFPFDAKLADCAHLESVPIARTGDGPLIEEEYALDTNGIIHIAIRNVEAGYKRTFELGFPAGRPACGRA